MTLGMKEENTAQDGLCHPQGFRHHHQQTFLPFPVNMHGCQQVSVTSKSLRSLPGWSSHLLTITGKHDRRKRHNVNS